MIILNRKCFNVFSAPRYVQFPKLQKNGSLAVVDWSSSFILNSKLKEFLIMSEGNILFRGISKVHSLERSTESESKSHALRCMGKSYFLAF